MNYTLNSRLLQFSTFLQRELFAWQEEEKLDITPKLQEIIRVLEFVQIERYVPNYRGCVGRHGKCRSEIARAFVAKKVLNLPTTEALIDRLKVDRSLRRICGFEKRHPRFVRFFKNLLRACGTRLTRKNARGID